MKKYNQKDINYIISMVTHIAPEIRDAIKEDICRRMKIPVEVIDNELKSINKPK